MNTFEQQNNKNFANRIFLDRQRITLQKELINIPIPLEKIKGLQYPNTATNAPRYRVHKTLQNSPRKKMGNVNDSSLFPDLFLNCNDKYKNDGFLSKKQKMFGPDVCKTTIIMDALLKLMNDQQKGSNIQIKKAKTFLLTESSSEIITEKKMFAYKKPKIIKNSITKPFFQTKNRRIVSEQRSRRLDTSENMKLGEYTFYGKGIKCYTQQNIDQIEHQDHLEKAA